MSTELSNGVIIPEEYSDDWYDEMSINLRKLNDVITAASDNATDIQRLDTDKANQSDLTALTSRVSQNETDIIALQTAVSGALKREIVQTLPTEDISTTTIYMIRNSESSGTNIYDEYMYINSQWELIGTSATDFSNYYTKNETDNLLSAKANQTDLTSLSGRVTQNETDITALQTAVSGALKREIVQSLPTQDISTTTIYMIRNTTTSGDNIYDEYMYINNLWELIGTSATDFSNYYTKTEIDTLLSYYGKLGATNEWTDLNTYSNGQIRIKSLSQEIGVTPSSSVIQLLEFADKNGVQHGKVGLWDYDNGASEIQVSITDKYNNGVKDPAGTSDTSFLSFGFQYNGTKFLTFNGQVNNSVIPLANNAYDLGSSSYQWNNLYAKKVNTQSVNGVEPSSLSLPSGNASDVIDITSYITDLSGYPNNYVAPSNGFVSISATGTGLNMFIDGIALGVSLNRATSGTIKHYMPILKGQTAKILIIASSLEYVKFIPCQGNI